MQVLISTFLENWVSFYANHAVIRTLIGFAHIAGLVLSGGSAIAADRAILRSIRSLSGDRTDCVRAVNTAHTSVIAGIFVVAVSGALLFAADSDAYLHSKFFWTKMGLFSLLMINGLLLVRTGRMAQLGDAQGWRRLRVTSLISITLWLLTTLAGAALPNIS
jgi:uncharacterized membrane protein